MLVGKVREGITQKFIISSVFVSVAKCCLKPSWWMVKSWGCLLSKRRINYLKLLISLIFTHLIEAWLSLHPIWGDKRLIEKKQNIWNTDENVVFLHQQFPPRLFTMRTRAELIFYTPMVTYTKQPISISDQMAVLKNRGFCLMMNTQQLNVWKLSATFAWLTIGSQWRVIR